MSSSRRMAEGGVKSASRVAGILATFEDEKRPLTIASLVRKLGYPQSSLSTIMQTLHQQGFVDYIPDQKAYIPSLQVALLGQWILESYAPLTKLGPVLRDLSNETGETIILGTMRGPNVHYLHVIDSVHPISFRIRTGTVRPLLRTSLGLVLISEKTDEEIGKLVRRHNVETEGAAERVDHDEIMAHVAFVRKNGYFASQNLATPSAGVTSVRLPAPRWMQPMAVGIGGPINRMDENHEKFVEILRTKILRIHQS